MPPSGAAMWGEARGRGAKPLGMPGGSAEGAGRRPNGPERAGGAKPQEAVLFFTPQAHTFRIRVIHKRQVSWSR